MKNKTLFLLGLILYFMPIQAKELFYYYRGERIPVIVRDDSVKIYYSNERTKDMINFDDEYICEIVTSDNVLSKSPLLLTSKEYIIVGEHNKSIYMSNHFYVQLWDSISDYPKLQSISEQTNTIIKGRVPYTSNWYELVVHNSSIDNTLEMSNFFYETGFFKDVDPNFIFNYSSSCVTDSHFVSQWGLPAVNINAYDCYTNDSVNYQRYGNHGTLVCGVIASNHNNERIAGIAPECKIMPISHPLYSIEYSNAQYASGFGWAVAHNADVINCSWGVYDHGNFYYLHSAILENSILNALERGRDGKGCVVVFGAGNENSLYLNYPAYAFPDILTVGAIDSTLHKTSFSSFGDSLDVVAPGESIYTTDYIDNTSSSYAYRSGTSLAAPMVSGIAGLILSVNPSLTQKEVVNIIESTAQKVGNYEYEPNVNRPNGTWNNEMGYGLVDAYESVVTAQNMRPIQGPDYVCDTAKYYLLHAPEEGSTISWSVDNGGFYTPNAHYHIVGPSNGDTVVVRRELVNIERTLDSPNSTISWIDPGFPGLDLTKKLCVTISHGATTNTYTKIFSMPTGDIPEFEASSTETWRAGVSRTFNITNCSNISDLFFDWSVKCTVTYFDGRPPQITTTSYMGCRSITYTPANFPPRTLCSVKVTARNLAKDCEERSSSRYYSITRKFGLSATYDGEQIEIHISECDEDEKAQRKIQKLRLENTYTLELWSPNYGLIRTKDAISTIEQFATTQLPKGVYILLLKEKGETIAETKVLLK